VASLWGLTSMRKSLTAAKNLLFAASFRVAPKGRGRAAPGPTGTDPKRNGTPSTDPCQLFARAAHCRGKPIQRLGRAARNRTKSPDK
jgi:hypothetical protein